MAEFLSLWLRCWILVSKVPDTFFFAHNVLKSRQLIRVLRRTHLWPDHSQLKWKKCIEGQATAIWEANDCWPRPGIPSCPTKKLFWTLMNHCEFPTSSSKPSFSQPQSFRKCQPPTPLEPARCSPENEKLKFGLMAFIMAENIHITITNEIICNNNLITQNESFVLMQL